jgi:hypothetical protein
MTFNIGSQNAQIINNAQSQVIHGGQQVVVGAPPEVQDAVRALRELLATLPVDRGSADRARRELDEVEAELRAPEPDKPAVDGALARFVRLVERGVSAGTSVAALAGPLQTVVGWLGTHGTLVAGALGALL